MKIFATLANIAFIILVASLFLYQNGSSSGRDIFLYIVFLALPIINIVALWISSEHRNVVSLFFERKRLEQEIEIAELHKKANKGT
jgi:hypothetical protein